MVSTVGRSERYQFLRNDQTTPQYLNGGVLIPVADGEYQTRRMSMDYNLGNVFIQFFNSSLAPVTPTAGTVTTEAGPYEGQWLAPSDTGSHVIQAGTIIAGLATYTPPTFDSRALFSRIVLAGVTGADFMIADHWRSIS